MKKKKINKLWGHAHNSKIQDKVIAFTSGRDVRAVAAADYSLLSFDIWLNRAHCVMLYKQNIISKEDASNITIPQIIGNELVTVSRNSGTTNTFGINSRLITEFTTSMFVPVKIGMNATFQCAGLAIGSGTLIVSPATLTIVPAQSL